MIEAMRGLGLKGRVGAFDDAVTTGLQYQRTIMEIPAALLQVKAAHRHAASIRYRLAAARLPVVEDIHAFRFEDTPINEGLVRSLHNRALLPARRHIVLVGGTGRKDPARHCHHRQCRPFRCPQAATSTRSAW